MQDVAVELPPLNLTLASALIERTRCARLLGAFRGQPAVDRAAVEAVLLRISELACEIPELRELDINPLLADPTGALALDARIVVARTEAAPPYAHLAIAPYPRGLARSVELTDGQVLQLRPIRAEDAQLETQLMQALSFRSRYFRFLGGVSRLDPRRVARLTQLDYDRELALIAVQRAADERALGVARYVMDPDGEGCEFAIAVVDAQQRRGLGRVLMQAIMQAARERGLQRIHGDVHVDNAAMLGLASRLGFSISTNGEDPTLRHIERAL
jgi:acetyltransferase